MIEALKQQWVTALRSGEFSQGIDRLKNGDEYCCLGVLCKVMGLPMNKKQTSFYYKDGSMVRQLSCTLMLDIDMPWDTQLTLIDKNDMGRTFLEIADYIEREL